MWYEGAAAQFPSTNNGLEGTNAWIKRAHTLRERLPVGQFMNSAAELVHTWSARRDPNSVNCVHFAKIPTISLKTWTLAYQWASQNKNVLQRPHENTENCTTFFVPSSTLRTPLTQQVLRAHLNREGKWHSFDEFKEQCFGIYQVVIHDEKLEDSTCTCPVFLKTLQCKHTLGMLIRLHAVTVPLEAKNVLLGQKRKRGRPTKAKQALLVQ